MASELDGIKGIGSKTKELLLSKLRSVKRIKEADYTTLEKLVGANKANILLRYFQEHAS